MSESGNKRKHDPEAVKKRLAQLAQERGERLEAQIKAFQETKTIYSTEKR